MTISEYELFGVSSSGHATSQENVARVVDGILERYRGELIDEQATEPDDTKQD